NKLLQASEQTAGRAGFFEGRGSQAARCRWLGNAAPTSADIVRLIVDDRRGHSDTHSVNETYNRQILRDVLDFVGNIRALIVTPAGLITTFARHDQQHSLDD